MLITHKWKHSPVLSILNSHTFSSRFQTKWIKTFAETEQIKKKKWDSVRTGRFKPKICFYIIENVTRILIRSDPNPVKKQKQKTKKKTGHDFGQWITHEEWAIRNCTRKLVPCCYERYQLMNESNNSFRQEKSQPKKGPKSSEIPMNVCHRPTDLTGHRWHIRLALSFTT